MEYYSQLGQDKFVDEFFFGKKNGTFLDIGAHDGVSLSNTYFLEKERGWTGICVEPSPNEYEKLKVNRKSTNLNIAISDFEGISKFTYIKGYSNMLSGLSSEYNHLHKDRIKNELNTYGGTLEEIDIEVKPLQSILDKFNFLDIDLCTIDTEGSELRIINSIDFSKTNIKMFIIENNYDENQINDLLVSKNYVLFTKIKWDDV